MAGLPEPKVVKNLEGRKAMLDAAEAEAMGTPKQALPELKKETPTGLPKPEPSLLKRVVSAVTGKNTYLDE